MYTDLFEILETPTASVHYLHPNVVQRLENLGVASMLFASMLAQSYDVTWVGVIQWTIEDEREVMGYVAGCNLEGGGAWILQ